ncbi:S41 family peptidase [Lacinutrix undariae]
MKILKMLFIAAIASGLSTSCFEDRDDNTIADTDVNDFVWKGMNAVYLYKAEKPDLADDRFSNTSDYLNYIYSYDTPEALFENLIHERATVDRFSWITDDYIALQQQLSGVSESNGLEYNFYYVPGSTTEIYGIIRLVLNNSVADDLGLQRGQIFTAVDDVTLTESNVTELLNQDTYTLNFANYNDNGTADDTNDDAVTENGTSISLTKTAYTENPVHLTEVIDLGGENLGYLMYNGFTADFNTQLNDAFSEFAASNIQHLVLDLRYNPGGSVNTAALLGSMITGNFTGEIFSKLQYNDNLQDNNTNYNFTTSFSGNTINSVNLNKIYVLTTGRTASASEMIINSLKEYIDVVQIGSTTTGKSQASITIYDSPDFSSEDINPSHTYAMQPLVAISVNVNDGQVPATGLVPTTGFEKNESALNFGVLGNVDEPLLATAIADIQGNNGRIATTTTQEAVAPIQTKVNRKAFDDNMYIDLETAPQFSRD